MDSDTRVILCGGLALFTGILLGTGLGLLMAPQTGRRTRRQIKNYLHDTSDRFYDLADESKDRMSEFMDKGKRFVEDRI
jgi:gas vesicle protein